MFKKLQTILGDLAQVIEGELELYKLQALRFLSRSLAGGFALLFFMLFFIIIMILGGLWLGFILSDFLGSFTAGFGAAVLVFLVLFLLLLALRKPLLIRPFQNAVIRFYASARPSTEEKSTSPQETDHEK